MCKHNNKTAVGKDWKRMNHVMCNLQNVWSRFCSVANCTVRYAFNSFSPTPVFPILSLLWLFLG